MSVLTQQRNREAERQLQVFGLLHTDPLGASSTSSVKHPFINTPPLNHPLRCNGFLHRRCALHAMSRVNSQRCAINVFARSHARRRSCRSYYKTTTSSVAKSPKEFTCSTKCISISRRLLIDAVLDGAVVDNIFASSDEYSKLSLTKSIILEVDNGVKSS